MVELPSELARLQVEIQRLQGALQELRAQCEQHSRTQDVLAEQAELLELTHDAILVRDLDDRISYWNHGAEETYGWTRDEAVGRISHELLQTVFPKPLEEIQADLLKPETWEGELRQTTKDGRAIFVSSRWAVRRRDEGAPLSILEINRNITARRRAEEERLRIEAQMQHAQKLESLGLLAGGIAHDFNNLLLAVMGNSGLAQLALSPASPARPHLEEIDRAAQRAADLCAQLLAYSGKGKFVSQRLDLNDLVNEMGHILEVAISKKAVLRYNLAPSVPAVEADPSQVRQVIMNLITNASDAIGEVSGVIMISTGAMECDRAYLAETVHHGDELAEGLYVFVEVNDTGCGMDRATMEKLFDPFFTTKFTGRGLGLASVLGIVRGHRGAIKLYSETKRGSSFKVLFPASDQPADQVQRRSDGTPQWRGEGLILVVDDEEAIRVTTRKVLEHFGFTVVVAADGREALTRYRESADHVRLVVLDMTMPHLSGAETFRELRRIRSDVRVLLSSGYNEQEAMQFFTGKGLAGFIQKPYRPADLVTRIRDILQQQG